MSDWKKRSRIIDPPADGWRSRSRVIEAPPDETSIASTQYGPEPQPVVREDLKPSAYGNIRDAAEAMGLSLPDKEDARGAVANLLGGVGRNFADEAVGSQAELAQILKNWRLPPDKRVDPRWARRNARDTFRGVEAGFKEDHPYFGFGLNVAGNVLTSPAKMGNLATIGEGMVAGVGASEELDANTPRDALLSGALSLAGKQAGDLVGQGVGWGARALGRTLSGAVKPSEAARYLQGKGVDDLTVGQMAPTSFLAQMEEAGTSVAGIGPALKGQRDAGLAKFQEAALREALPPGTTTVPEGANLGERLAKTFGAFDDVYAKAHGHPIAPDAVRTAVYAVDDPSIYAGDSARAKVGKFIQNRITALRLREDGSVLSDDVIKLRSALRERVRALGGPDAQSKEERELFQAAADAITDTLDAQLPSSAANTLRAADGQYAKLKTVADAIGRAKDQTGGFTTQQLTNAVQDATDTSAYQKGGGLLRQMSRAGEESIGAKIPMTGARLLASGPVPYATGPLSYMANLPGPKRFLTGGNEWQQAEILSSLAGTNPEALGELGKYVGKAAAQSPEALAEALLEERRKRQGKR